jgi:alpha-N-arabinofuranosidase
MSRERAATVLVNPERTAGKADPRLFGHFLEHFHRQIYGGVYEPGSPLADAEGFRTDVAAALRDIRPQVIRWPGGCFVSAYHWRDGVGRPRQPAFDKAWRVEESNAFGTDEFVALCRRVGAEPYICGNAGTGTPEEMADWVEYCNLEREGRWARLRRANGHPDAYRVRYWSIGNENYLPGEMGSKTAAEWGRFVRETAKMMKRVDPSIELFAASVPDLEWNRALLAEAGDLLDWVSIHGYWDRLHLVNKPSPYEVCMAKTLAVESRIRSVEHMLGALGRLDRIRIAFDEWNLRGWHHPNVSTGRTPAEYITPRDENDRNETYTMADAVFSACFLNTCLRHCATVGMANFSPTVNTRGVLYAHPAGVVLRSTYHVFRLYADVAGATVVDSWCPDSGSFDVTDAGTTAAVPNLDVVAAVRGAEVLVCLANRSPDTTVAAAIEVRGRSSLRASLRGVTAPSADSYNDVDALERVTLGRETTLPERRAAVLAELPPHSVHLVRIA